MRCSDETEYLRRLGFEPGGGPIANQQELADELARQLAVAQREHARRLELEAIERSRTDRDLLIARHKHNREWARFKDYELSVIQKLRTRHYEEHMDLIFSIEAAQSETLEKVYAALLT